MKSRPLARTNGHWLRFVKTKPKKHTAQVEPGASDRIRRKRILQGLCHVSSFLPAKAVSSAPREGLWRFPVTELGLLAFLYPSLPWSQKLLERVLTAGSPSTLQGWWWGRESCEFAEQPRSPQGFPGGSDGQESACNAGDLGSIPGSGRSPGVGKGYPLQYSGLEDSRDCTVHGGHKKSDAPE